MVYLLSYWQEIKYNKRFPHSQSLCSSGREREKNKQVNKNIKMSAIEVVCRKLKYGCVKEWSREIPSQKRTSVLRIDDKTDASHPKTRRSPFQGEGTVSTKDLLWGWSWNVSGREGRLYTFQFTNEARGVGSEVGRVHNVLILSAGNKVWTLL